MSNEKRMVNVDHINELLNKVNLYYNHEEDMLMGTSEISEESKMPSAYAIIGEKLPPIELGGMLDEYIDDDDIATLPKSGVVEFGQIE